MTEPKYLTVSLTNKEIDRIFSHIEIDPIDPLVKCWSWTGAVASWGYAQVSFRGNYHTSLHRLIYSWLVGPIPDGFGKDVPILDHLCNNPRCCNPSHLRLVTHRENILRGGGPPAINARKKYCIRGHLLPEISNRANGIGRDCLVCRKEHNDTDAYRTYMRDRMRKKRQSH